MLKESEKKNLERVLNKPIMLGKGIILFFTYLYLVIAEQLDIEDEEVCDEQMKLVRKISCLVVTLRTQFLSYSLCERYS